MIAAIIALVTQLGPLGLQVYSQIESRLNLSADEKQNIADAIAAANLADDATIAGANDWLTANGFPPLS